MLNAQPDMVCGRYGDGGECDKWMTREQAAEASASIEDFPVKTMENKNRVARKFLKLKSRLYKKEDWKAVYLAINVMSRLKNLSVNLILQKKNNSRRLWDSGLLTIAKSDMGWSNW